VYIRSEVATTDVPLGLVGGIGALVNVDPVGIQTQ